MCPLNVPYFNMRHKYMLDKHIIPILLAFFDSFCEFFMYVAIVSSLIILTKIHYGKTEVIPPSKIQNSSL